MFSLFTIVNCYLGRFMVTSYTIKDSECSYLLDVCWHKSEIRSTCSVVSFVEECRFAVSALLENQVWGQKEVINLSPSTIPTVIAQGWHMGIKISCNNAPFISCFNKRQHRSWSWRAVDMVDDIFVPPLPQMYHLVVNITSRFVFNLCLYIIPNQCKYTLALGALALVGSVSSTGLCGLSKQ